MPVVLFVINSIFVRGNDFIQGNFLTALHPLIPLKIFAKLDESKLRRYLIKVKFCDVIFREIMEPCTGSICL